MALAWSPFSDDVDFAEGVSFALSTCIDGEQSPWSKQERVVETLFREVSANLRGGAKAARQRRVCLFAMCCLSAADEHARRRCWQLVAPSGPKDLRSLFDFFFGGAEAARAGPGAEADGTVKDHRIESHQRRRRAAAAAVSLVEKALLLLLVWIGLSGDASGVVELAELEPGLHFFQRFTALASRRQLLEARSEMRDAQTQAEALKANVELLSAEIESGLEEDNFYEKEQRLFAARQAAEVGAKRFKAAASAVKELAEARDTIWQMVLSWGAKENVALISRTEIKGALDSANVIDVFLDELEGNGSLGGGGGSSGGGRGEIGDEEDDEEVEDEERVPGQSMPEWRKAALTLLQRLVSVDKMFSLMRRDLPKRIASWQRRERVRGNDLEALAIADDISLHYHCLRIFLILKNLGDEDDQDLLDAGPIVAQMRKHFRLALTWSSSYEKLCQEAVKLESSNVLVFASHAQGHCTWW